jgi:hypothetical protein
MVMPGLRLVRAALAAPAVVLTAMTVVPGAAAEPPWSPPVHIPGSGTRLEIEQPEVVRSSVLWFQPAGDTEGGGPLLLRGAPLGPDGRPGQARTALGRRALRYGSPTITGGRDVLVATLRSARDRRFRVAVGRSATGLGRFRFQRLGLIRQAADEIALAQAASGAAAVAYRGRRGRPQLAVRRPGRARFGSPRAIAAGRADSTPAVAVGPRGRALVAWKRGRRLFARFQDLSGRRGRVRDLGRSGLGTPPIACALGRDRRAVVAWLDGGAGRTIVRGRVAGPGGRFGAARELDRWARFDVVLQPLRALVTADGRPVVAWTGELSTRAAVAVRGAFSTPQDLGTLYGNPSPQGLQLDVGLSTLTAGPGGSVLASFVSDRTVSSAAGPGAGTVQAATLAPGAPAFGPTETVAVVDDWLAGLPAGGTDGTGRPVAAWKAGSGVVTATRE